MPIIKQLADAKRSILLVLLAYWPVRTKQAQYF